MAVTNQQTIELLLQAYSMELETVMNYLANSVNLDGVRAEEIKKSLGADVPGEIAHAQQLAHRIKQLGGHILVLEDAHFCKELIAEDRNVGLGQAGSGEHIDHLSFSGYRLAHQLADGGIDLFRCLAGAGSLFGESGLERLKETHIVADLGSFITGGTEGEGAREFGHHLQPALLAVLLLEDVLLTGGKELQALGGGAAGPVTPVKTM